MGLRLMTNVLADNRCLRYNTASMRVYIGADHGGFKMKEALKTWLQAKRVAVVDVGNSKLVTTDDYPDFAKLVARKVAANSDSRGVLLCRNGVGVCIVANKVKGIRAALSLDTMHARSSRRDDDANVLCVPADYVTVAAAKKMVGTWLRTPFSGAVRHRRRLAKIKRLEA